MIDPARMVEAARRAAPFVLRTPVLEGPRGVLKLESLQPTGSFKVRGFFAAALALPPEALARGLLTVSAGNAAQACAYAAHRLGVGCRVVMFDTAPAIKFEGVRRWGGVPIPMPRPELLAWMEGRGWESEPEHFIHPFADEEVMAGHGGLGLEIVEQVPDVERVLVPVGGGGLVSGVAAALKAHDASIEVIGVQSDGYPLWPKALEAGGPVSLSPATIADGTAAPFVVEMFDRLKVQVDRWLVVPEPRLRQAVRELAADHKVVAEGGGALAYAGLDQLEPGPVTVAVTSGGNIDRHLLAELLV